jgi:hypothetical protein
MEIDDYGRAIALTNELKAALPFRVQPGRQLLKAMEGEDVSLTTWLEVDTVAYSGDMGGIMINLLPSGDRTAQVYSVSLTHVVFDPEHELAAEVRAYQRQRTRRLALQDRGGFAAELSTKTKAKKRRSRKGFMK